MAADSLDVLIRMRDELTKPLTDQQKALKKVTDQIRLLTKQQRDAAVVQKKHLEHLKEQRKNTTNLIPGIQHLREATEKYGTGMGTAAVAGGAMVTATLAVIAVTAALAAGVVYTTTKVLEMVSAETSWAEKTRGMFAVLGKVNDDGRTQLKIVQDLATELYVAPAKIADTARDLLEAGVRNQRELQNDLRAVTELQRFGGDQAAGRLKDILKRSASTRGGFLGKDTWAGSGFASKTELQNIGVDQADFYKRLSKIRGVAVDQFKLQNGLVRVTSKQFQQALTESISQGKVGKGARDMVGGFEELRVHISAVWQKIVSSVNLGPLFKALHELVAVFDPLTKSGKSAQSGLTLALNAIVKAVTWMVRKTTILLLDLQIAFLKGVIKINGVWNEFATFVNKHGTVVRGVLLGLTIAFAAWAAFVLLLAGAFVILWAIIMLPILLVIGAFIALGVAIAEVRKHFDSWKQAATDAAANLIDGLVSGLRKGVTAVVDAAKAVGQGAITSLKNVLGIHSPSKVFESAGLFSGLGFERGLTKSISGIDIGMPGAKLAGAGGGPGEIHLGGIQVSIQGVEKAEQIVPHLIPALTDAIESILLEYGHG